jgi:hypothetical protein
MSMKSTGYGGFAHSMNLTMISPLMTLCLKPELGGRGNGVFHGVCLVVPELNFMGEGLSPPTLN